MKRAGGDTILSVKVPPSLSQAVLELFLRTLTAGVWGMMGFCGVPERGKIGLWSGLALLFPLYFSRVSFQIQS